MTTDRRWVAAILLGCVASCELSEPPPPPPIDCESDRATERYPEQCGDAGEDSGSDDE